MDREGAERAALVSREAKGLNDDRPPGEKGKAGVGGWGGGGWFYGLLSLHAKYSTRSRKEEKKV